MRILALWGCPIFVVIGILALSIFDYVPWYANAIIICIFLLSYWLWQSSVASLIWAVFFTRQITVRKEFYESLLDGDDMNGDEPLSLRRHYNAKSTLFRLAVRQGAPLLVGFLIIFGACWFLSGGCVAVEPISFSFKGMRALSSEVCNSGLKPCVVYLTAAGNASSSVFVVFHTNYRMKSPNVKLSLSSQPNPLDYDITLAAEYIEMDLEVPRFVYMAYVSHLEPQKPIYFVAGDGQTVESYCAERSFLPTASSLATQPLKIISTGDVGLTKLASKMLKQAAAHEPSLILLGGDLAYANGMKTCYRRWDSWLRMYADNAVTPAGHSIPLLTSIGNHEAGGFYQDTKNVPFYLNYFFHEGFNTGYGTSGNGNAISRAASGAKTSSKSRPSNIPTNTYHNHDVSGVNMVVLDSDVIASPLGAQYSFLEKTLNESRNGTHPTSWSLALYHAPMYPSVRKLRSVPVEKLQNSWGRLFSKYQVEIAFENHDHAYKRTHPIKDGKVVRYPEKGTVFLGDGALGVPTRRTASIQNRPYLAYAEGANFYFYVLFTQTNVSVEAINDRGVIFDSYFIHK